MSKFDLISRVFTGVTVGYTTYRLLEDKTDELVAEGGMLNAFAVGAGHMGLAVTAGWVATIVTPKIL